MLRRNGPSLPVPFLSIPSLSPYSLSQLLSHRRTFPACAAWSRPPSHYFTYYLRQGGYVVVVVCLSVRLFVCLLATLRKNFWTDLHEIFREGWQWANEQTIKFWWRSGSRIRIRIRITTLVRRALADVCIVLVLLVEKLFLCLKHLLRFGSLEVSLLAYDV